MCVSFCNCRLIFGACLCMCAFELLLCVILLFCHLCCLSGEIKIYIRARVLVMLHVVFNFPRLLQPDQNMPYLSSYHQPVQNSAKFRGHSVEMGKFHSSAQNSTFHGKLWSLVICTGSSISPKHGFWCLEKLLFLVWKSNKCINVMYPGRNAVSSDDNVCVLYPCSILTNSSPAQCLVHYLCQITVQTDRQTCCRVQTYHTLS